MLSQRTAASNTECKLGNKKNPRRLELMCDINLNLNQSTVSTAKQLASLF